MVLPWAFGPMVLPRALGHPGFFERHLPRVLVSKRHPTRTWGPDDCDGEAGGWISFEQAHRITQTLVTAHFGVHLVGDERYAPWLETAVLSAYPELVWTQE